jgi:hypothetical protein
MMKQTRALATLALIALAACSGGGQSTLTPAAAPVASAPASGGAATTAKFTITVPAATTTAANQRTPAYVSPSTQSVVITLTTVNGSAYTGSPSTIATNLTTSNPNCTGSPLTCTVSAPATAGTDVFVVSTYSQQQTGTSPTAPAGSLLSQATLGIAVAANQANTATTPLILNGAASTFVISGLPSATTGTAFTSPHAFIVNAKDASGNTIVGTYLHSVTLTDGDTSGATTIVTSGSDNPPSGTLLSSADTATLNYTGATLASATITAGSSGATTASIAFMPSAPSLTLTNISAAVGTIGTELTATITGSGFTNASTIAVSGSGVTVQTTYVSATSLTATIFTDAEAATGVRNVSVTDGSNTATLASAFSVSNTGVSVVTLATDTAPGSPPGSGAGAMGDLRYAMSNAPAGNTIVFDTTAMGGSTITLAGPLPPIEHNVTIDGGYYGRVTIDGASLYRVFFVDTGTVAIRNLALQNALAKGGNGGDNSSGNQTAGPGGGGFGAGACVFVNQSSAAVTISNDYLTHCTTVGGNGGSAAGQSGYRGGGGGGLDADGGTLSLVGYGGGGGGGVLGAGSASTNAAGGAGGVGGGGGGGGACSAGGYGTDGVAYGSNSAGSAASSTGPGNGGFGGGGGGASNCSNFNIGGNGGFGGGGGGGESGGVSGSGGVGGGGAGASGGYSSAGTPGNGGIVAGAVSGGAGGAAGATTSGFMGTPGSSGGGGGGAAAGPAIFVTAGSLTITNSGQSSAGATAGTGGTGGVAVSGNNAGSNGNPGTADQTPVFNYAGTVNGSGTPGPVSGALGTTTPTALMRRP